MMHLSCYGQYRHRLTSMERDLEYKEAERHRACRDYDRLQKHIEEHGIDAHASTADSKGGDSVNGSQTADRKTEAGVKEEKSTSADLEQAAREKTLRDNVAILSTKLYHERTRLDGFRRDLERYKALEQAVRTPLVSVDIDRVVGSSNLVHFVSLVLVLRHQWTKEEASLKQEYADKTQQLRDESSHHAEEFAKIRFKAKVTFSSQLVSPEVLYLQEAYSTLCRTSRTTWRTSGKRRSPRCKPTWPSSRPKWMKSTSRTWRCARSCRMRHPSGTRFVCRLPGCLICRGLKIISFVSS
jgi:hypothetical protein